MMGNFFRDAIEAIVDTQFTLGMRSDVAVWTAEPVDDRARYELARLPGVTAVESTPLRRRSRCQRPPARAQLDPRLRDAAASSTA